MVENIRRERPDIIEAASKKDKDLLKKLEDVYVSSQDPQHFNQDINSKMTYNPERPMPAKGVRSSPSYGFSEASQLKGNVTSAGKVTMDTAQLIMAEFSRSPTADTLSLISSTHGWVENQYLVKPLEPGVQRSKLIISAFKNNADQIFYFRIPPEKLASTLEYFRIFHLSKATPTEAESETVEDNPLKAKSDWVSIEDSELSGKKKQTQLTSKDKSLPMEPRWKFTW